MQYAKVNETTFKTLDIAKEAAYNFEFVSLEKGTTVDVEPAKDRWDLKWGYSMYFTNFGAGLIPYGFSDLVFTNSLVGVEAAEVLTTATTYDAFAETNLTGITFNKAADAIGSKWRVTQGTVGVKTDRFYLIKDPAGNIYKLRFISFHANDGGERGKPKLEYKLVKKRSLSYDIEIHYPFGLHTGCSAGTRQYLVRAVQFTTVAKPEITVIKDLNANTKSYIYFQPGYRQGSTGGRCKDEKLGHCIQQNHHRYQQRYERPGRGRRDRFGEIF